MEEIRYLLVCLLTISIADEGVATLGITIRIGLSKVTLMEVYE